MCVGDLEMHWNSKAIDTHVLLAYNFKTSLNKSCCSYSENDNPIRPHFAHVYHHISRQLMNISRIITTAMIMFIRTPFTSQWRHNGCDGVKNRHCLDCLFNRLSDQRKHQSPASLAFVWRINPWLPLKGLVTRKMFPFDDVNIMKWVQGHVVHSKCCVYWARLGCPVMPLVQ